MNTQNTLDSIPNDLFHEIFSRLPIKTVGRCRCVLKILASRLSSEDFKELFLTTSLTRPRLLFAIKLNIHDRAFYLSPQPQNPYEENSSLEVKADFHSKFSGLNIHGVSYVSYASGLFYYHDSICYPSTGHDSICNPSTGRYVIVPKIRKLRTHREPTRFLGFDPIDKQFKLLAIDTQASRVNNDWVGFVLTLGTGKMRWRTIRCPFLFDYPRICSNGISINGILYYLARDIAGKSDVIVCFDVRTETFEFKPIVFYVEGGLHQLINYNDTLAITILWKDYSNYTIELYMLVLEDEEVETEEWWWEYTLPSSIEFDYGTSVVGITSTDEIVLMTKSSTEFYLYYFNLENNSLQNVKVQGLENHYSIAVIMDYVEDLHINDATNYFKSNIHAKPQEAPDTSKRQSRRIKFQSINKFEALCLSDEEDNDA